MIGPNSYVPQRKCAICATECEHRATSMHGVFLFLADAALPPEPGEDLLPWLDGPVRQGWWDRIALRGVA
jgi:hypothetical protein